MASEMTNTQSPAPGVAAEATRLQFEEMAADRLKWKASVIAQCRTPAGDYHHDRDLGLMWLAWCTALQASAAAVEPVGTLEVISGAAIYSLSEAARKLPDGEYSLYTAPPLPAQVQEADELQPRIDWCLRVLSEVKELGREKPLGDLWPQVVVAISALKVINAALASRTPAPGMAGGVEAWAAGFKAGTNWTNEVSDYYEAGNIGNQPAQPPNPYLDTRATGATPEAPIQLGAIENCLNESLISWHEINGKPAEPSEVESLARYLTVCIMEDASIPVVHPTAPIQSLIYKWRHAATNLGLEGLASLGDCADELAAALAAPHPAPALQAAGADNPTNLPESLGETVHEALVGALQARGYRADGDNVALARRAHLMALEDRDLINMQKALIEKLKPSPIGAGRAGS